MYKENKFSKNQRDFQNNLHKEFNIMKMFRLDSK